MKSILECCLTRIIQSTVVKVVGNYSEACHFQDLFPIRTLQLPIMYYVKWFCILKRSSLCNPLSLSSSFNTLTFLQIPAVTTKLPVFPSALSTKCHLECEATFGAGWQDWLLQHPWGSLWVNQIVQGRGIQCCWVRSLCAVSEYRVISHVFTSFFLISPCLNLFAVPFTSLSNFWPKGKSNTNFNFLPLTRLIRDASSRNEGWVMLWILHFCDSNQVWGF